MERERNTKNLQSTNWLTFDDNLALEENSKNKKSNTQITQMSFVSQIAHPSAGPGRTGLGRAGPR